MVVASDALRLPDVCHNVTGNFDTLKWVGQKSGITFRLKCSRYSTMRVLMVHNGALKNIEMIPALKEIHTVMREFGFP